MGFGAKAPGAALEAELRKATLQSSIDVPEDAVNAVVLASHNADDRRQIMLHLHGCLAASASSQWRRVYSGLVVLEALLERGSPLIISEVADGVHCDLVQRLSFVENYEYGYDSRVQDMLRRRASNLRTAWLERQLALVTGEPDANTDTDESGEDDSARRLSGAGKPGVSKTMSQNSMTLLDDSTTDGESNGSSDPSPRPAAEASPAKAPWPCNNPAAAELDLLGGPTASPNPVPAPQAVGGLDLLLDDGSNAAQEASASAPKVDLDLLLLGEAEATPVAAPIPAVGADLLPDVLAMPSASAVGEDLLADVAAQPAAALVAAAASAPPPPPAPQAAAPPVPTAPPATAAAPDWLAAAEVAAPAAAAVASPAAPPPLAIAPQAPPVAPAVAAAAAPDWLAVAEAHGLYAPSAPGAGDLPALAGAPAAQAKVDSLLDL